MRVLKGAERDAELVRAERREQEWKAKAREYKKQLQRGVTSPAAGQAVRLADARQKEQKWEARAQAYKQGLDPAASKCDNSGCWVIDTSDATTQATLQKFRDAVGSRVKPPIEQIAAAADSAVRGTLGGAPESTGGRRKTPRYSVGDGGGKPLAHALRPRCDNPYAHAGVENSADACAFVRARCPQRSGVISYQKLVFCQLGGASQLAVLLLLLWLVVLSIWLALAADEFLCPCLTVMSRVCRMSDNVAGVTFLALGNGAPDIFSQIAAAIASPHGAEMALGEVLGSSMMISAVIFGLVAIAVPHTLPAREFSRDVLFFLAALVWLFAILLDSHISSAEAAGFIALYGAYLYVVIVGVPGMDRALGAGESKVVHSKGVRALDEVDGARRGGALAAHEGSPAWGELPGFLLRRDEADAPARGPGAAWARFCAAVQFPGAVAMRLSCAVVNPDADDGRRGWCKAAALCQATLAPVLLVWCVLLHGFSGVSPAATHMAYALALVLGLMLAAVVNATSRVTQPPAYHDAVAFFGFVTSIAWIYALAAEMIHVLQAMGAVVGLSDTILGLTVLAFANSVGDLAADLAMARAGMPAMAAAACIGSPLLNLLLGSGLATLLGNWLVASPYPFELNLQLYACLVFQVFTLVAMLAIAYAHKWEVGRNFGVGLILIYVFFMVTCLGLEVWGGAKLLHVDIARRLRNGQNPLYQ